MTLPAWSKRYDVRVCAQGQERFLSGHFVPKEQSRTAIGPGHLCFNREVPYQRGTIRDEVIGKDNR